MSPKGAISVEHVWKRFRADPEMSLLRERVRQFGRRESRDEWRWVLRDVGFEIEPGEAVGLFGVNGSGKSTLLKLMTKVLAPHSGAVRVEGLVGALIELQAGMHPELSGRENIFLYGAILGLSKNDVRERFDEIVDFSGVGAAIDRPLKFYSTGMTMRLGFSIATHTSPDVLLIDEVLAVGDTAFQSQCLTRLAELLLGGTTLILVSHDLASIEGSCRRGLWLDEARLRMDAPVSLAVGAYRRFIEEQMEEEAAGDVARVTRMEINAPDGRSITTSHAVTLELEIEADDGNDVSLFVGISQGPPAPIITLHHDIHLAPGRQQVTVRINALPLAGGTYYVYAGAEGQEHKTVMSWQPAGSFVVEGPDPVAAPRGVFRLTPLIIECEWGTDGGRPAVRRQMVVEANDRRLTG